jgi:hypothetical protein
MFLSFFRSFNVEERWQKISWRYRGLWQTIWSEVRGFAFSFAGSLMCSSVEWSAFHRHCFELSKNLCINDHDTSPSTRKLLCRVAPWVGCHQLSATCHWRLVSIEFAATTHPPAFDKWGFLTMQSLFVWRGRRLQQETGEVLLSLSFNSLINIKFYLLILFFHWRSQRHRDGFAITIVSFSDHC